MSEPAPVTNQPVAIVTGAGSGIGRATASALSAAGYCLALVGRRTEPLEQTAALLSTASLVCAADLRDPGAIVPMISDIALHFGWIDVLVNNAGDAPLASIDRSTPELIDETYRVNAIGPANLIAAVWPHFQQRRSGCIVNVSSMATLDPFPGFFAYAGAKAACNLMARSCAKEGRAIGVRAFAVAPGAVETPMLRKNFSERAIPPRKCLLPEQVAAVILECVLGRRDADNGTTIPVPSP